MLSGRLILITTTYYNKILDDTEFSYFVAINKVKNPFIKIKKSVLDKKSYIYPSSIIQASSNILSKMIDLDEILLYSPFIKGTDSKKINYYKNNKCKNNYKIEKKSGIINFD